MVCVLVNGPHAHEHFKVDRDFAPPERIEVQGRPGRVAVYTLTDGVHRGLPSDHFAYRIVKGKPAQGSNATPLVRFIDFA